jgi:hypothetical protein
METGEIVELAEQARKHAEEGNYWSIHDWRRALGVELEELSPTSEMQSRRAALSRASSVDAFAEQPHLPAVRCSRGRTTR